MYSMKKLFFYFILIYSLPSFGQDSWELKKTEHDIKVYTRAKDSSAIKEYKVTMSLTASKEAILATILDAENIKNWNYKTTESRLIKQEGDSIFYVYMYNDLPWPVMNRDFISKLTINRPDKNTITIAIVPGADTLAKRRKGVIRMTKFKGTWLLKETANGTTEVTQQIHGEPEGNLPLFIINSTLVSAPFNTFLKLREILKK